MSQGSTSVLVRPRPAARGADRQFGAVLAVLLVTGWVANHFVALMPTISDRQHLSTATLDAIFGIYALGLLPGLLIGGRASDAFGRQAVALTGSTTAVIGTVAMLLSQQPDVLLAGRLIVGAGVGLAMTSGTAWASDLRGPAGAATAGAVLIAGFAIGPLAGGLIAGAGDPGVEVSFGLAAGLVLTAMAGMIIASRRTFAARPAPTAQKQPLASEFSTARAFSWAMPLAPWVFASATLGFITIPARVRTGIAAPTAAGMAALIVNGSSGVIQVIARAGSWGPRTGTVGAALAALGYSLIAVAPPTMTLALALPLLLILGCASGLSLREGLIDLEAAAPQHIRGALTGMFYSVTYIGFALPLVLTTVGFAGSQLILAAMAALAASAAALRTIRLRRDSHRQS
ncbi:MFS transporter [Mycobacterium sp. 1245111.1]|uniref:MFS transporter n=1 Tax=Mycobacterium sp. 1245111.1 TaxID=1834073 RepID=UPI0007FF55B5|nr:MFS transporter [Mycobacterium sp. 1245111.1]OBK35663.1 MFS transporter [Mycobacterium sp. 1245111.1]